MPTPLGLAGLKGSGKDASFQFIHEWADQRGVIARHRGFADAMKLSFARMFIPDCSVDEAVIWCNEIKQSGTLEIYWASGDLAFGTRTEITHRVSGRTTLQRYGTEGHRDVFGGDFWVDILFPLGDTQDKEALYPINFRGPLDQFPPEICVATDVRFTNEAERINSLGGYVIKIERPELITIQDSHISEAGLDDDLVHTIIVNDGSLDDLRYKIIDWCEDFLTDRYPLVPDEI